MRDPGARSAADAGRGVDGALGDEAPDECRRSGGDDLHRLGTWQRGDRLGARPRGAGDVVTRDVGVRRVGAAEADVDDPRFVAAAADGANQVGGLLVFGVEGREHDDPSRRVQRTHATA